MSNLSKHAALLASAAAIAAIFGPVIAQAGTPVPSPGFDPDNACIGNARALMQAVMQYARDNGDRLPPTDTPAHFQLAMGPYLGAWSSYSEFICPATSLAYKPNPAVSGRAFTPFDPNNHTVIVFEDAQPHPNHKSTVTFLDDHIEVGGVTVFDGGAPAPPDPDGMCAEDIKTLTFAAFRYAQANGGKFPLLDTAAHAQAALLPYTNNASVFTCPATGQPYKFNAGLSRVSLRSLVNPATTVLVQDSVNHAYNVRVTGYADGHVNHPLTTQLAAAGDPSNLQVLGSAIRQAAQANGGVYPSLGSESAAELALAPYVSSPLVFANPLNGQNYTYNTSLGGKTLAQIANPAQTWVAQDKYLNPDGTLNILSADGHVQTREYYLPQHFTADLLAEGGSFVYNRADNALLIGSVFEDGSPFGTSFVFPGPSNVTDFAVPFGDGGDAKLLFAYGDTASLWDIGSGSVPAKTDYGHYFSWSASFVSIASAARILWKRTDGTVAIWNVNRGINIPNVNGTMTYASDQRYKGGVGDVASGFIVAPDGTERLVWTRSNGEVRLWNLSAAGDIVTQGGFPSYQDWKVKDVTIGYDGNTYLLFAGTGGSSLIGVTPTQAFVRKIVFPGDPGWTSQNATFGGDLKARVFDTNDDGRARIRVFDRFGALLESHEIEPKLDQ